MPPSLQAKLLEHGYQRLCNVGNIDSVWVHWDTMKTAVGRLMPGFKPGDRAASCSSIIFNDAAGECAKAHNIHRKSKYRISGKQ